MSTRNLKVSLLPLVLVGALLYLVVNLLVWSADQRSPATIDPREEAFNSPNIPPLPYSPWGYVKGNGENAPLGAVVSAWCTGVQYAYTGTLEYQGNTAYALDVPGDETETGGEKEGCAAGETVVFKIDGYQANETAAWTSGEVEHVDLTYSYPTATPTPTASATPTVSATPTASQTATSTPTSTPTATPTSTSSPTATPVPPDDGWRVYLPFLRSR
jgi:hypothetical protein